MKKKSSIYLVLLIIVLFNTLPKVYGQCVYYCVYNMVGTYSGGLIISLDSSNHAIDCSGVKATAPFLGDYCEFSGIDCISNTFGFDAGHGGCVSQCGYGSYSRNYDTVYLELSTCSPGDAPLPPYTYKTCIRQDYITINPTFACSGNNGTALARLSGFSADTAAHYSYLWSNGQTTNLATGLSAGTYTVTVTTSYPYGCMTYNTAYINNCASYNTTAYVTILPSSQPTPTIQFLPGSDTGSLQAIATGGTPPYNYMWVPQDSAFSQAAKLPAGVHTVMATDANGCAIISSYSPSITTTVSSITIYPNPFNTFTTVALSSTRKYFLELDDISGRKLQYVEFTGDQYQLSAEGLAKGLYFLRIYDANNSMIGVKKIVVQ